MYIHQNENTLKEKCGPHTKLECKVHLDTELCGIYMPSDLGGIIHTPHEIQVECYCTPSKCDTHSKLVYASFHVHGTAHHQVYTAHPRKLRCLLQNGVQFGRCSMHTSAASGVHYHLRFRQMHACIAHLSLPEAENGKVTESPYFGEKRFLVWNLPGAGCFELVYAGHGVM